jgi:hypothetical protein
VKREWVYFAGGVVAGFWLAVWFLIEGVALVL